MNESLYKNIKNLNSEDQNELINNGHHSKVIGGHGDGVCKSPDIQEEIPANIDPEATGNEHLPIAQRQQKQCSLVSCLTVAQMKANIELYDGMVVNTAGYYTPGDGGGAQYLIGSTSLPSDEGSIIGLDNGLQANLIVGGSINYKQFGAVGDGMNDDGLQIKQAHQLANTLGLPVINESGEFWIKGTHRIEIQTNVRWGHTILHIDEGLNTRTDPRFIVSSRYREIPIEMSSVAKAALLEKLKPGTTLIPELVDYKNCLVFVVDADDKVGIRYGYPRHRGWSKEEFFYVEEHGRIVGEIAWSFHNYTSLIAYPCDENVLIIEGGTFFLSGDSPGVDYEGYWYNGFVVNRSRTIIRNQWIGLEPGREDVALDPRRAFYSFERVYDVILENVRLIPWEKDRPGTGRDVPQGTYGLGGNRTLNATFRNITAEGSAIHWGVFGTNLFKNFRIEHCRLNRVDVHFHCWNLYVKDSEIGYKGFTLTGGGDLFIENTKRYGNQFINFRRDYGARWDGHIRLRNCRLIVEHEDAKAVALNYVPADFDYKYPIGYGRSIKVDDFTFDYTGRPGAKGISQIMQIAAFSKVTDTGERVFFPQSIEFRNIQVSGRAQGVRILAIPDSYHLDVGQPGGMDGQRVIANCIMRFENIQGEKVPTQRSGPEEMTNANFVLNANHLGEYEDEFALYPQIEFNQVGELRAHLNGGIADVYIRRSVLNGLAASSERTMRGRMVLEQCDLRADAREDGNDFFALSSELGTYFVNCTIHSPVVDGVRRPDLLERYGFIDINHRLQYHHLNTSLSRELVEAYAEAGNPVEKEFWEMLKSRHAEESEWMARRKGKTSQRPTPASFHSERGFQYFDTDLDQLIIWNGQAWVSPGQVEGTLYYYSDDVGTAPEGMLMKRLNGHPSQAYVLVASGTLNKMMVDSNAIDSELVFEIWKNGSRWAESYTVKVGTSPSLIRFTEHHSFLEGDRITVMLRSNVGIKSPGTYVTVDLYVDYCRIC